MAAFLGCLEYVLEEGPNNDWFQDEPIAICAVVVRRRPACAFFWRVFTARQPIVDLLRLREPQLRGRLAPSPSSWASGSTA